MRPLVSDSWCLAPTRSIRRPLCRQRHLPWPAGAAARAGRDRVAARRRQIATWTHCHFSHFWDSDSYHSLTSEARSCRTLTTIRLGTLNAHVSTRIPFKSPTILLVSIPSRIPSCHRIRSSCIMMLHWHPSHLSESVQSRPTGIR